MSCPNIGFFDVLAFGYVRSTQPTPLRREFSKIDSYGPPKNHTVSIPIGIRCLTDASVHREANYIFVVLH